MMTIWTRALVVCLGSVAVTPLLATQEMGWDDFAQQLGGGARTQRPAARSPDVGGKTLAVEAKRVSFSLDAPALVRFSFDSKGYRNTYLLDCENRQFRWIQNVRLSTGAVTGNSTGADWKPLNPRSTISNAVFNAACPQALAGQAAGEGSEVGERAQGPSFDCSTARSWSERTVCNNPNAAALDLEVSRLYRNAKAHTNDAGRAALKNAQLAWLRERENCKQYTDKNVCLLNAYTDRIAELRDSTPSEGDKSTTAVDGYTVPALAPTTLAAEKYVLPPVETENPLHPLPEDIRNRIRSEWVSLDSRGDYFTHTVNGYTLSYLMDEDIFHGQVNREPAAKYRSLLETELLRVIGRPPEAICTLNIEVMRAPETPAHDFQKVGLTFCPDSLSDEQLAEEAPYFATTVEGTTGTAAPAAVGSTRISMKDGSVLAGVLISGKVAFRSSFGKITVTTADIVSWSKGKLTLADGTVLNGKIVGGDLEITTSVGVIEVDAEEVVGIERGASLDEQPDSSSGEKPSEVGPSREELELHLVRAAGAIYAIDDLEYEVYPAYAGNGGRISCTGRFVLGEPLYDRPPTTEGIVTVSRDAGISPSSWWKYGQNKFEYFWLAERAGVELPFRCELAFRKQVDRWFISGQPAFSPLRGKPEKDLPDNHLIVGSDAYRRYVGTLQEKVKAFAKIENDLKQELENFFSPGRKLKVRGRDEAIADLVMETIDGWREGEGRARGQKLVTAQGEATITSETLQHWYGRLERGVKVMAQVEVWIEEDVNSPGIWEAEAKITIIDAKKHERAGAVSTWSAGKWDGTGFRGNYKWSIVGS